MARMLDRLSPARVRTTKKPGMLPDGGGLYLQITIGKTGAINKSWLFRYAEGSRRDGSYRERMMGLGPLGTLGLAAAREKAAECRRLRLEGIDPKEQRDARRAQVRATAVKAMTFDEAAAAYMAANEAGWRSEKHRLQWSTSLAQYVSPVFGKLPVSAIDDALVMRVLDPIWNHKTETANRIRGRMELGLDWAKGRGLRTGENPARWRGGLEAQYQRRSKLRKVQHHEALPYGEIGTFMMKLRACEGAAARALEFTVLIAGRSGEVLGATWDEIDFPNRMWIVPDTRMKGHREHRVPLSDAALAVLEQMSTLKMSDYIFPGFRPGQPLGPVAMLRVLGRLGYGGVTVHGFRSSFRDWAAERTRFPSEVAEAALAHILGDQTERAYQRGDLFEKRRKLMDAWAQFCVKQPAAGTVVVLRA